MLLPDVSHRHREPELLDSGELERARHIAALRALATVNVLSLSAHRVWRRLEAMRRARGAPLRLLDVACGGGDVVVSLLRRARAHGIDLEVDACDADPVTLEHARAQADRNGVTARFFQLDALSSPLPAPYDLVCSSLFLHHVGDEEAVGLLKGMAAAARGAVLVQDLVRSRAGYALAWLALRAFTRSDVARVDGARSVRAAYTIPEVRTIARRAGLERARVTRCWPQRFVLEWSAA